MDAASLRADHASLPWRVSNDLAAWYVVAASSQVREKEVLSATVAEREIVLFRSGETVHALDPHCPHMGAKLCAGKVDGEHLVCPLHGWRIQGDGRVAGLKTRVRSWPVVERMGAVLVFNGPEPLCEPPAEQPEFFWTAAQSGRIDAPWFALTANAFDTHHYEAVHKRRLREPPLIEQPNPWQFSCSYRSQVTGHHLNDRLMKWLSGNDIKVTMTCIGGVLFTVSSVLGKRRASLLVGMTPEGDSTRVRLMVGSTKRGLTATLSRYLYTSFLKNDLEPMTGIRLNPFTGLSVDATIERFAHYLDALPEAQW